MLAEFTSQDGYKVSVDAEQVESVRESVSSPDPRCVIKCRSGEVYYVRGSYADVLATVQSERSGNLI